MVPDLPSYSKCVKVTGAATSTAAGVSVLLNPDTSACRRQSRAVLVTIVACVGGAVLIASAVTLLVCAYCKRRRRTQRLRHRSRDGMMASAADLQY